MDRYMDVQCENIMPHHHVVGYKSELQLDSEGEEIITTQKSVICTLFFY